MAAIRPAERRWNHPRLEWGRAWCRASRPDGITLSNRPQSGHSARSTGTACTDAPIWPLTYRSIEFYNGADGARVDAELPTYRRAIYPLGELGDHLVELEREPRPQRRPGDLLHPHAEGAIVDSAGRIRTESTTRAGARCRHLRGGLRSYAGRRRTRADLVGGNCSPSRVSHSSPPNGQYEEQLDANGREANSATVLR